MEWYKHDSSATQDAKIRKLLIHSEQQTGSGAIGYAIYFHCLELITSDVSINNLTFELEHDSELIADTLRIRGTADKSGREIVEGLMRYMIDIGLFECSGNRIFCTKLLKRLDSSMTSNTKFRKKLSAARDNLDTVMTGHDPIMKEKNRTEQKRIEENTPTPFRISHEGESLPANETRYHNLVDQWGESVVRSYLTKIILYRDSHGKRYKDYAATVAQWIQRDIDAGKGPRKAHKVANLDDLQSLG